MSTVLEGLGMLALLGLACLLVYALVRAVETAAARGLTEVEPRPDIMESIRQVEAMDREEAVLTRAAHLIGSLPSQIETKVGTLNANHVVNDLYRLACEQRERA